MLSSGPINHLYIRLRRLGFGCQFNEIIFAFESGEKVCEYFKTITEKWFSTNKSTRNLTCIAGPPISGKYIGEYIKIGFFSFISSF